MKSDVITDIKTVRISGYQELTNKGKALYRAKCQELVSNAATALTALFQQEGAWPRARASRGATDGELDKDAALPLATKNYLSLAMENGTLSGYDKFGVVSPWAMKVLKAKGTSATRSTRVSGGGTIAALSWQKGDNIAYSGKGASGGVGGGASARPLSLYAASGAKVTSIDSLQGESNLVFTAFDDRGGLYKTITFRDVYGGCDDSFKETYICGTVVETAPLMRLRSEYLRGFFPRGVQMPFMSFHSSRKDSVSFSPWRSRISRAAFACVTMRSTVHPSHT